MTISLCCGKTIKERTTQRTSAEMKRAAINEGHSALQEPIDEDKQRTEDESRDP